MEQSMLNKLEYTDGDLYVNDLTIVLDKLDPEYLAKLLTRFPEGVHIVLTSTLEHPALADVAGEMSFKPIASYEASGIINSSSDYSLIRDEQLKNAICKELIGSPHPMVMEAGMPPADFDFTEALYVVCGEPLIGPITYALAYLKK